MLLTLLSLIQLMHLDIDIPSAQPPPINLVFEIEDFDPNTYITPDATNILYPLLITEKDHSDFLAITYQSTDEYHNFVAQFSRGYSLVIKVFTYYSPEEAVTIAREYAHVVGQIPHIIRFKVETLRLFPGDGHPTSGVHTKTYIDLRINKLGVKEENLIHDFVHASLNGGGDTLLDKQQWISAVDKDGFFPSYYAASQPWEEDVPESIIPYLVVRWRPERFDPDLIDFYEDKMSARFSILDKLDWNFNK